MKRYLSLSLCALFFLATQSGAEVIPPHALSLELGGVFPHAQLDTGPLGGGDQTIGDKGGIAGIRYMYASNPRIDLGVGLQSWNLDESEFTAPPLVGKMDMEATMLMALVKIHPSTTNRFMPYFLGGLGLHFSKFESTLSPSAGYVWSSAPAGGTEERQIVSDEKTGLAGTLGVGMDFNVTPRLFLALEGRFDFTSKEEYEATTYGQALGLTHAEASAGNTVLSFLVGYRFGATNSPAAVEIPQPKQEPAKGEGAI